MQQPPQLTDRVALMRNRARAAASGHRARFLHDVALDEVQERLSLVNRTFTKPAVITGAPDIWRDVVPNATVVADDDTLTLAEGAHDLVIHAMCLHWANDPVGQLVQARRALAPDGMFLAVFFGGQTLNELRSALAEAETMVTGGLSPRILPMGEIRDLGGLLQRAGLNLPVADTLSQNVSYGAFSTLLRDLRDMGEGNALAARHKGPAKRAMFDRAADIYAAHFTGPDGRLKATFELLFLTGWCPHDSQQKPLRPGSAKARLADALKVPEIKLKP